MPRPNQPRSIASEQALARRVANLRAARGMSYEGLAARMEKVGCPINASAIYKIEKSNPPRRITVDELVAFSQVFGVGVEELLLPPEIAAKRELVDLLVEWDSTSIAAYEATERAGAALDALRAYVSDNPEIEPVLHEALSAWADHHGYEQIAVAHRMFDLTRSDKWRTVVREFLEAD